ncbi:uncharacterized protein SRS1_10252 [Sporisorium reilianum f. sp. reilianum]|uniref:BSD domain-containing protein n=1 Tax=Sporisorium reilianum f. sp. reilianum TaxID=72559 RepID=A0A2N8U885_9BASI|nr:uncharacterized protein SRS1_10252 [Sporisorium reilianum f. sp. reilianum]
MDIYDPGLMAGSGRADGFSTPTTNDQTANKTELDQNVEKLVGNISNWWTGFAKKSQDSITQARKEMESRGGIVNYAKSEYAKLESSIGEAQKKARDQSQQQSQEANQESDADPAAGPADAADRSEISKGKQRAIDDIATAPDSATAPVQGPTLGASVSSLFSKLTSDPRLVQLQHSLTTTLQSVSSPAGTRELKDGNVSEKETGATPVNIQESLSKLSLTIQSHLPHLDLKESQQLATRYLHATESFAREMQSDMKEFVGELVRIVPPEGETGEAGRTDLPKTAGSESGAKTAADLRSEKPTKTSADTTEPSKKGADAAAAAEEEEDFAWDEDDEEAAAASTGAAAPAVATEKPLDQPAKTTVPAASEAKPAAGNTEESEEDSDWE